MWRRLCASRVASCKFRSFSSRQRGVVVYWDDHRAFGKVQSNDGRELFVHKSSLREEVKQGSAVDFEVQWVEEKKQDHAKDVRLVKPEATLEASRIQAVRAEDLLKVEPLDLTPATEGQHLEMMAKQMEQLRQQGLQSQQLLAQNQQLLVQSQQLLVQGLFALIQQQNVQNANLERALLALTNKMGMELPESRLQADLPLKFPSTGSMPGAADMSTAAAAKAEVQPAEPNPSPEKEVATPVSEAEGVKHCVEREETSATALEEEAETSEEEPLGSEPTMTETNLHATETSAAPAPAGPSTERNLHATETEAEQRQVAETSAVAEEEEASAVEVEEKAGSFNLVGSFNDWDAENYPLQGDSWRVSIRNNAPMGSRKGFQREEFQILQDGSWESRLFPAGGTEETVVLLRPGRWNRAAMSSEEHPGHGRNWAVEGKPGAAFKVSLKDRTVSCEHA
eukprot:Skav205159  [mRNA]  locus=scaffold593:537334:538692:- [translate_table: standard]